MKAGPLHDRPQWKDAPSELKERVSAQLERENQRMLECRCRSNGSCILVDGMLGWHHGMPIEDCDTCLGLGGEHSDEAASFRSMHAMAVVGALTRQTLYSSVKPPRGVMVALTVKHRAISEDRFAAPDIQAALRAPIGWVSVKPLWERAESLMSSLWSKWRRVIDRNTREKRQISCWGTDLVGTPVTTACHMLREKDGHFYCGACGCGANPIARLGSVERRGVGEPTKLDFPKLECPLQKPGFANERTL